MALNSKKIKFEKEEIELDDSTYCLVKVLRELCNVIERKF